MHCSRNYNNNLKCTFFDFLFGSMPTASIYFFNVAGLGRYDDKSAGTPAAAAAATTAAAAAAAVAKEGDVPKPKKFFKSRDPPEAPPAVYSPQPDQNYGSANKRQKNSYGSPEKDVKSSAPKKFFSSKNNCSAEKTVLSSNANNAAKRAETKPPIVLRICRGKFRKPEAINVDFFLVTFEEHFYMIQEISGTVRFSSQVVIQITEYTE